MAAKKKNPRNMMLAKIHIAKKDLGMDDDTYREMLFNVTGKNSCSKMTDAQLRAVLQHLKSVGFKTKKKGHPGRPKNMDSEASRAKQLQKIEAYLADSGLPWAYADALAKKICKVDKIIWVDADQLYKIITALEYNARRTKQG